MKIGPRNPNTDFDNIPNSAFNNIILLLKKLQTIMIKEQLYVIKKEVKIKLNFELTNSSVATLDVHHKKTVSNRSSISRTGTKFIKKYLIKKYCLTN